MVLHPFVVDYILFLTADVTVKINENEVDAYKYVDKDTRKCFHELFH